MEIGGIVFVCSQSLYKCFSQILPVPMFLVCVDGYPPVLVGLYMLLDDKLVESNQDCGQCHLCQSSLPSSLQVKKGLYAVSAVRDPVADNCNVEQDPNF